ncbi:hypothetical protein fnug_318 [Pseudomonas phage fnug]|uniref:Uncharacterized protein n=2 Tax=Phikzvirus phiKZ TaxID=169683 RepID=A0A192Y717_9CAUD|nr:hypothetical protein KTN4_327 [Pseudomonas phage KTN4]QJB22961.1 hypothetical protein fnug_318 [Pseudomonas phage fnug]UXD83299.1 hypothetical protein NP274_00247 [Pseudomonas phage Koomba boorn-mokiny kep-wari Wadjak 1]
MKLECVRDTAQILYSKRAFIKGNYIGSEYHIYQLLTHLHHRIVNALIEIYDDDSLTDVLNKSPDDIIILFSKHATNAYQHYKVLRQNINAKIEEVNASRNRYTLWSNLVEDILKFRLYCSKLKVG